MQQELKTHISLKNLFINNEAKIGLQFYPNKIIQALVKGLPGVKWSKQFSMVFVPNTPQLLDLIFETFKGVCWVNTSSLFKDKIINKKQGVVNVNWYRERKPKHGFNYCPESFLLKLELKKYALNTVKSYVNGFELFMNYYYGSQLSELNENDIRNYLQYLIQSGKSDSTVNLAINSIKFYYEIVLGMPNRFYSIERPRPKEKLPEVISKVEVKLMIDITKNLKHKTIISLLYSTGMRRGELLNLKINEIDSKRMLIKIKDAKGGKERITLLSEKMLSLLREYYKNYTPKVYLFEGQKGGRYSAESIVNIVKKAASKSGINTRVTPHMLRHSFATHLIEDGTSIRFIQQLLGHSSIKTTEIYTNVSTTYFNEIKNPFDTLG